MLVSLGISKSSYAMTAGIGGGKDGDEARRAGEMSKYYVFV
jgi:hypothetical protein